jgi:hypothetical protein
MKTTAVLSQIESVQVTVLERSIALEVAGGASRSFEYADLRRMPARVRPAYGDKESVTANTLDLLALLEEAVTRRQTEARFEEPYSCRSENGKGPAMTILRTVTMRIKYKVVQLAKSAPRPLKRRLHAVRMPMGCDGLWPVVETAAAVKTLAGEYWRLSPEVIRLAVRLAKLDLPPLSGRNKLLTVTRALLNKATRRERSTRR